MAPIRSWPLAATVVLLLALGSILPAVAQTNVTTQHYDNARSGLNAQESILTPSNVNSANFGKLFSVPVDGYMYAQPLYLSNVTLSDGVHNIVYAVTEHDGVYAIDADTGTVLWYVSFINPSAGITTVSTTDVNCKDLSPEIGITSTPVIDQASETIYVVARTKENGSFFQRLHALDLTTGAEKPGSPVTITATVAGTGDGSVNGTLSFDPLLEHNRPGLLLQNGHLIIAWGSHCDNSPFHGWIMSYNSSSLAQEAALSTTPTGGLGGVWMAGSGLAGDSSFNTYFASGNGTYDGNPNFADSVLKVGQPNGTFPLLDWFTPFNQQTLSQGDEDVGSGGVLLLPDQPTGSPHIHLMLQGGKQGVLYLLDRDNMGHFQSGSNSQIIQNMHVLQGLWSVPAWWNNSIYVVGTKDFGGTGGPLQAYSFNSAKGVFATSPSSQSSITFSFPGPTPVVSANDVTNAIVWVIQVNQYNGSAPAVLRAFDANNLSTELYDSQQNSARDTAGLAVKFSVPTVVNGKVYVGTQNQLSVYGELALSLSINPSTVVGGNSATGTVWLGSAAPAGGTVVNLSSGNSGVATVPPNVTVPAGAMSANFTISTNSVQTSVSVPITASDSAGAQTATIMVNPVIVGSTFVRAAGGYGESKPFTVGLAPSAGDFLGVFVWQEEQATTPSVSDNLASSYVKDCDLTYDEGFGPRRLTVFHLRSATDGITTLTVTPSKPSRAIVAEYAGLGSMAMDVCGTVNTQSSTTTWSSMPVATTGTDLIFGLADTGFSDTAAYKATGTWSGRLEQPDLSAVDDSFLEDELNVPAGTYTATGTTTAAVGEASVLVAFKTSAAAAVSVASLSFNPPSVTAGYSTTGTVTLNGNAPGSGAIVALSSSDPSVTVPANVNVPAGATTATFTAASGSVSMVTTSTITATYNGSQSSTVTVDPVSQPVSVASVSLNPTTVTGGSANSIGTVTLTIVPSMPTTVTLASSDTAVATVPSTVTVQANSTSATFTVTSHAVTAPSNAVITGTLNGSASATLTVDPASAFGGIRVNSGGPAYTDSMGHKWTADTGYSGGSTFAVSGAIANTNDPTLYRTERWGSFTYTFKVPSGPHSVTLKFAETSFSGPGQRLFSVAINGANVLSNFDIYAAAGGARIAVDRTFSITSSGTVTIQFVAGSADQPKVDAIDLE